jgi:DNA-directed RNA polymerase subunit RPC12/RpoP
MALDKELANMKGVFYECVRCGLVFDGEKIAERGSLKCPDCGYRVIKKVKSPIVHRIKAV